MYQAICDCRNYIRKIEFESWRHTNDHHLRIVKPEKYTHRNHIDNSKQPMVTLSSKYQTTFYFVHNSMIICRAGASLEPSKWVGKTIYANWQREMNRNLSSQRVSQSVCCSVPVSMSIESKRWKFLFETKCFALAFLFCCKISTILEKHTYTSFDRFYAI